MNFNEHLEIKKILNYSWFPFFSRFGKLTSIQLKAIPKVLQGINTVISAPTATGKTEAIVAPLAERFKKEKWNDLSVIYIVPTRSLANDLFFRLKDPLQDINIKLGIKHSDTPPLKANSLPNFLITTPETLDSIICRKSNLLRNLKSLIIDEIHLIDNTYRGDQLSILLKRLGDLTNQKYLNINILSATLSNPNEIAKRYVEFFEVVSINVNKKFNFNFFEDIKDVVNFAKERKLFKILCFCNSREAVENYANELIKLWHPYPVFTYHSSLSSQERKEAATSLRESSIAICISTSSMEVGIDIGDLDLVVICEPPLSLSSFIQRIGRGGRRTNIAECAIIYRSTKELEIYKRMTSLANLGLLEQEEYKQDFSVVVQQIFSILFQFQGGVPWEKLYNYFASFCSYDIFFEICSHLENQNWIEFYHYQFYPSSKLLDLCETGLIHSNIPDSNNYQVIDIDSDQIVGTISGVFDKTFILSGKIWQVISVSNDIIKVKSFKGYGIPPTFKKHKVLGKFFSFLPESIKHIYS